MKYALRAAAFAVGFAALPALAEEFTVTLSPGMVVSGENTSAAFQRPGHGWYGVRPQDQQGMATQLIIGAVTSRTVTIDDNSEFDPPFSPCAIGLNPTGSCTAIKGVR